VEKDHREDGVSDIRVDLDTTYLGLCLKDLTFELKRIADTMELVEERLTDVLDTLPVDKPAA
jgi:hypothetical protein